MDWQPAIVAAGASTRFGSDNKLFADLCGRPVLGWSIEGLLTIDAGHPLLLVVAPESEGAVTALVARMGMAEKTIIVRGGARRRDSVEAALRVASADYVAIHDGARPLVDATLLRRVLEGARGEAGAVPGLPITDTIAAVDRECRVTGHLERNALRALQTPQVVRRADWLAAAELDGSDVTDDSAMLARLGRACVVVEGDPANVKITRPADLATARAHLAVRGMPCSG